MSDGSRQKEKSSQPASCGSARTTREDAIARVETPDEREMEEEALRVLVRKDDMSMMKMVGQDRTPLLAPPLSSSAWLISGTSIMAFLLPLFAPAILETTTNIALGISNSIQGSSSSISLQLGKKVRNVIRPSQSAISLTPFYVSAGCHRSLARIKASLSLSFPMNSARRSS